LSCEEKIRERMLKAPFKSQEKNVLKLVLSEVQQRSLKGPVSEEQSHAIVKAMINTNVEKVLVHLSGTDPRRAAIEEENLILSALLPKYLGEEEILLKLEEAGLVDSIRASKGDGMATGLAMKFLKGSGFSVEGEMVTRAVRCLRA
jgi:hypothetical protein